jgi:endonuclease YncB( thermonuclease family)
MLMAASFSIGDNTIILPIIRVIDGDTIATSLPLPAPLNKVEIRLLGIDTPESTFRAKCPLEQKLGHEATEMSKKLIGASKSMVVTQFKYDKYGSRIDGVVHVGDKDLGAELIKVGLAKPYTGQGPKPDWCKP